MAIRVAIEGYGGLGRQLLLAVQAGGFADLYEIAAIYGQFSAESVANRLRYDSVYGCYRGSVDHAEKTITVGETSIDILSGDHPDWASAGIDVVVLDASVPHPDNEATVAIERGARKVVVVGRGPETDLSLFIGVNDAMYDPDNTHRIATGSAIANALVPLLSVFDQSLGVGHTAITALQPPGAGQSLVDALSSNGRMSRSAWRNIVPGGEDVGAEIALALPGMAGKIDGQVVFVPVMAGGWFSLTTESERRISRDEVAQVITDAATSEALMGVIGHTSDPLVSSDLTGDSRSVVVDLNAITVNGRTHYSVRGWFDTEWSLSCRCADLLALICEVGIPGTA